MPGGCCRASRRCGLRARLTRTAVLRLVRAHAAQPLDGEHGRERIVDLAALRRARALRPPSTRPPPPAPPSSPPQRAPEREIQLNADIQACNSAEAVLDLVTPQLDRLAPGNASTALSTIHKRAGRGQAASRLRHDARFVQLMECAAQRFGGMQPRHLTASLYSCGKLGIWPPAEWLLRFWPASASKLDASKPQDFSITLYACGQLGLMPPASWLLRYWQASSLKLGQFKTQELSNTLYACGQMFNPPPSDWMQLYWHVSALKLFEYNAQDFSNTLYACGQLGITPPADWLERY